MNAPKFVYRIVHTKHEGYSVYFLQEENGKFYFISKEPSKCFGYSEDDIQQKFKLYEEAMRLPVINFEDIRDYNSETAPRVDNIVKNFDY